MNDVIIILSLMALAVLACITQNWLDKMTAEEKMSNALIVIIASVLIVSVTVIVLIFF